jgi:hypothetical protein
VAEMCAAILFSDPAAYKLLINTILLALSYAGEYMIRAPVFYYTSMTPILRSINL